MVDMPAEFGGQGRSYLLKMSSILAGALFFYSLEYFLFLLPKLFKVFVTYFSLHILPMHTIPMLSDASPLPSLSIV